MDTLHLDTGLESFRPTQEMLRLVAEIDEFKGAWRALRNIAPERLTAPRRVATIESVGSSTRIEGVRLTNAEVKALLSGPDARSFRSRDEEVAGYAAVMETVFASGASCSNTVTRTSGIAAITRHCPTMSRRSDRMG
ncbi:MAG TPA: hypothetical protein VEY92_09950 [Pseudoxanthomonas sp.]|nr:hypothetical protein [Pseudoxanthomonas sp.]